MAHNVTGDEPESTEWATCTHDPSCTGAALQLADGACLAHVPPESLRTLLRRMRQDGSLDARGVRFNKDLTDRVLEAFGGRNRTTRLRGAAFDGATFEDTVDFLHVTFAGKTSFTGATFNDRAWFGQYTKTFLGEADFSGVTFRGEVNFMEAKFMNTATFERAVFEDRAVFGERPELAPYLQQGWDGTVFEGDVEFSGAVFQRDALFIGAWFLKDASFRGVTFRGEAEFGGATFATQSDDISFDDTTFQGEATFNGCTFATTARFSRAQFERARSLGPLLATDSIRLDGASFLERVTIDVTSDALSCAGTQFRSGVLLRARWAEIILDDADFGAVSLVTSSPPLIDEAEFAAALGNRPGLARVARPRLLSLRRADVGNLALSSVDLRACRFAGAHNLDRLRLPDEDSFADTPRSWRWARRLAIAEEHLLRSQQKGRKADGWCGPECDSPRLHPVSQVDQVLGVPPAVETPPPPRDLAAIYRALRKGREDTKDEPGAADFYYGEMEMRRIDPSRVGRARDCLVLLDILRLRASRQPLIPGSGRNSSCIRRSSRPMGVPRTRTLH